MKELQKEDAKGILLHKVQNDVFAEAQENQPVLLEKSGKRNKGHSVKKTAKGIIQKETGKSDDLKFKKRTSGSHSLAELQHFKHYHKY